MLLYWVLFFVSVICFTVLLYWFGYIQQVAEYDYTRITFMIMFIFFVCSLYCGKTMLSMVKNGYQKLAGNVVDMYGKPVTKHQLKNPVEIGYFVAEVLSGLGMLGTVIGMLDVLLVNLPLIDPSNIQLLKQTLGDVGKGIGTALITTIGGLSCSILLKCQFMVLDKTTDA